MRGGLHTPAFPKKRLANLASWRPNHAASGDYSPLMTLPKRSKVLPLNLASCICEKGR
jgi:hypothetical protein